jgi:PIN domain nuclease of toxin-antitoxin system
MNPLLLDTHVLVWMVEGSDQILSTTREEIEQAAAEDTLLVSAITPWEIALLVSKSRLRLSCDVGEWVDTALKKPGVSLAPLLPSIAVASTRLPWDVHPDPADRILLATARHLGATLVTADRQILEYAAHGFVKCLAAS